MNPRKSLKVRILLFLGGLTTVMLAVVFVSVLLRWRALILNTHRERALAVAQTFSTSLLDAIIYQENRQMRDAEFLANHIHRFLSRNPYIKNLVLYDEQGVPIFCSRWDDSLPSGDTPLRPQIKGPVARIYRSRSLGWIIETTLLLRIHNRQWGWLRMAFDAEPAREQMRVLFCLFYGLGFCFVLILLAATYLIVDRLTRSLRHLVAEMGRLDLERIEPSPLTPGEDEVGMLVQNFEMLKSRLAQSRRQLLDAQRQLYQAEKLASIGRLAAGVAHEINNPLHGLKSCLFAMRHQRGQSEDMGKYLSLADEAVERISGVVEKLLNFSRQGAQERSEMNLNETIEKALALFEYRVDKAKVSLVKQLDPSLPTIYADPQLIGQVVMNMLINSYDSMPDGGEIRISTSRGDSEHVYMVISDTGSGIAEEHLDKIFDPFFTTKAEGKGTGLGLSVSLGIVEAHGGSIQVSSQVGVGSTFRVTLPIGGKQ
ncbi:MAG: ATP-binding protein [candidate division KSB1 bacterium]|nr:ATP-binding protein [candidate division KSB1 bacterium]MDZ7293920.1 ATP-binding protein [candidate division KSB1 bacterium]MDZ7385894.1 ATP-binding protein [candidate division KSB1 bacterium]MDZ7393036.1 ATP-binding protein [candidate division KSB1 bacterium]MDZ7414424.1 ATP-binding protein [candidate division KSB1 bacterium]